MVSSFNHIKIFTYKKHNFSEVSHFTKICLRLEEALNINLKQVCLDFYQNLYDEVIIKFNETQLIFLLTKENKAKDFYKSKTTKYKFILSNKGDF